MKKTKRILTFIMASCILLTTASCAAPASTNDSSGSGNSDMSSEESSTASGEPLSTEEILAPFEETVTLTSVKVTNSAESFGAGQSIEDNILLDKIYEDLNIKVEYDWVVDVTQRETKESAMIAGGTAPDFFHIADAALARSIMEDGISMDITDVYNMYASENLKAADESFPEAFNSTFIDGRMMGISELGFGVINEAQLIWLRKDWLEASGKDIPKTMDELIELARVFMEQNPGTYGIAVDRTMTNIWNHSLIPFMNAYGAYSKIWIEKDGQLEYSSIQPEMKEALEFIQGLYAEGIIDQEFSVKDTNAVGEDVAASKVGIVGGVNWIGWDSLGKTVALDPNASWIPIEVPMVDEDVKLQSNWPVAGYFMVNANCEHPEAVIKILSWYVENDAMGTFATPEFVEMGNLFAAAPIFQTSPAKLLNTMDNVTAAFEARDPSTLPANNMNVYNAFVAWYDEQDPSGYGFAMQQGPDGAFPIIREYIDNEQIMLTGITGVDPADYALIKSTLQTLEDDYFTRIIMGESIDSFDQFVEDWKALGGETSTASVNEVYN